MSRETYEELRQDTTGTGYFWDPEVGVIFRKFQVDLPRVPELRKRCVGDLCPSFDIINLLDLSQGLDTDCRTRAYPKYQEVPLQ